MRTYDLVFDTKMPLMPAIYARQNDAAGSVVLNIQVVDNGKPVTLGDTLEFRGLTADKQYVISDRGNFTNLDKTNGSFSYAIPNQICAVPGRVDVAYFSVVDAGGRMSTLNLTIIVEPAGDLSPQHAKDYISVVDNLEKVVDDKIDSASKDLTDTVSTLQANVDAAVQSFKAADFYTKSDVDSKVSTINAAITEVTDDAQTMADQVSDSALIVNDQASSLGSMTVAAKVLRDSTLSAWVIQATMIDPTTGYMYAMLQSDAAASQHIAKIDTSTGSVITNRDLGLTAVTYLEGCAMWHDATTGDVMFVIPLDAAGNWCLYDFDTGSKGSSFKIQGSAKYCIDSSGTYFCTLQERYDYVGTVNQPTLGINVYTLASIQSAAPVQSDFIPIKDELVRGSVKIQGFMMIGDLIYIGRGSSATAYRLSVYDTDGNLQNDYSYDKTSLQNLLGTSSKATIENEGVSVVTVNGVQYPGMATLIYDNSQFSFAILAVGTGTSVEHKSGITPADLSNISQTSVVHGIMSLTGTIGILDWALSFKEVGSYFFTAVSGIPQMGTGMVSGVGVAMVRQLGTDYSMMSVGITFIDYNNNVWSNYYTNNTGWKGWAMVSNGFYNAGGSYDPLTATSGRVITNSATNAPSGATIPMYYDVSVYGTYKVINATSMASYARWYRVINGSADSGWKSI